MIYDKRTPAHYWKVHNTTYSILYFMIFDTAATLKLYICMQYIYLKKIFCICFPFSNHIISKTANKKNKKKNDRLSQIRSTKT